MLKFLVILIESLPENGIDNGREPDGAGQHVDQCRLVGVRGLREQGA